MTDNKKPNSDHMNLSDFRETVDAAVSHGCSRNQETANALIEEAIGEYERALDDLRDMRLALGR